MKRVQRDRETGTPKDKDIGRQRYIDWGKDRIRMAGRDIVLCNRL